MKRISARERLTPHFRKSELACRCRRPECDAPPMDPAFMQKLENLREDWGLCMIVTSGARCSWWNSKVGGAEHSQHLYGLAADFHFEHPSDIVAFVELAEKHGFGGIGVGTYHLVHLDGRSGHEARWTYGDK